MKCSNNVLLAVTMLTAATAAGQPLMPPQQPKSPAKVVMSPKASASAKQPPAPDAVPVKPAPKRRAKSPCPTAEQKGQPAKAAKKVSGRASLGVTVRLVPAPLLKRLQTKLLRGQGLLVAEVTGDGPAASVLLPGDILRTYELAGPQILLTVEQLRLLLAADTPNRKVTITLLRGGQAMSVNLVLGTSPASTEKTAETAPRRPSVTIALSLSYLGDTAAITSTDGVRFKLKMSFRDRRSGELRERSLVGTISDIVSQLDQGGIPCQFAKKIHARLRQLVQPTPTLKEGDGSRKRSTIYMWDAVEPRRDIRFGSGVSFSDSGRPSVWNSTDDRDLVGRARSLRPGEAISSGRARTPSRGYVNPIARDGSPSSVYVPPSVSNVRFRGGYGRTDADAEESNTIGHPIDIGQSEAKTAKPKK